MRRIRLFALLLAVVPLASVRAAAAGGTPGATGSVPIVLEKDEILPPQIKTSLGVMPGPNELPERKEMPDVLTMNDGTKVTTARQWAKRRDQMRTILEYYAVGQAPPAPDNLKATVVKTQEVGGGRFKYRLIHLTFGPKDACSLDFGLWTSIAGPPVGVIICQDGSAPGAPMLPRLPQGVNQGRGQDVLSAAKAPLPKEPPVPTAAGPGFGAGRGGDPEFAVTNQVLSHGYAYVTYNPNDCAEDTTARMPDGIFAFRTTRFFPAYPNYDWGVLRAWAWGASRIIDYLVTDPAIDKTKIAITGVSRNGKSSLIAGAFDDRITLVAPVASSGGGTPAFRFSGFEHGGNEGLSEMVRKYPNWFSPHLHEFFHQQEKLPFDNHWYLALCAPRAVIALEGTNDQNVNKTGVRQSFLAARPAFELLGVKDRLAVNWANRPHGLVQGDWDALFVLADKVWNNKPVDRSFDEFPETASMPAAALKLSSVFPSAGPTNVCIDTPLHLTFDGPPALAKSGVIQILDDTRAVVDSIDVSARTLSKTIGGLPNFNYYPIIITGNEAVIAFKNSILAYGKTYEVKIPAGVFVDKDGNAAGLDLVKTWRFSTKPAAPAVPAEGPRRITVAADGTGDFATVQGAIDFVPSGNTVPTTLFLRKGTYNEIVHFSGKHNLTILGEDRKGSIIMYADNQNLNNTDRSAMPGGYRRGMLRAVDCNDLTIAHLTLCNPTPQGGGQSEAIILNGGPNAHAVITDVDLYGHQDTLQVNGQAYISNCYIEGDVDFMWGTGPCFFENCRIRALRSKSMYTQIRNPATNHGYVYRNCTFEGAPGVTDCILSRIQQTRFPASEVVLLDCTLTSAVSPVGWSLQGPGEAPNLHFWEYNNRDPNGKPIDDSKRLAVSKRLTKEADAEAIANYSNPAWVLGNNWNPILAPIFTKQSAPAADASPATQHPALFLVGDSIMKTGTGTGETGPWGYGSELVPMFDPAKIHVYNEGRGGRSSRGYIEEGAWKGVLTRIEPGDWVLVQFGHNDAANSQNYPDRISGKGSGHEISDINAPGGKKSVHSYGWYLKQYVKDAAGKGAKVVIVSPVPRNQWTDGKIKRGFDGYVQWAADAARASGAFYIDLNALASDRYDALGQPAAAQMFNDTQHTKKAGAKINAESLVAGLKQLRDCPLVTYLAAVPSAPEKQP